MPHGKVSPVVAFESFGGTGAFPAILPRSITPDTTPHSAEMLRLYKENPSELFKIIDQLPAEDKAYWEQFLLEKDPGNFGKLCEKAPKTYTLQLETKLYLLALLASGELDLFEIPRKALQEPKEFGKEDKELLLNKARDYCESYYSGIVDTRFTKEFTDEDWIFYAIVSEELIPSDARGVIIDIYQAFFKPRIYQESALYMSETAPRGAIDHLVLGEGICHGMALQTHLTKARATPTPYARVLQCRHSLTCLFPKIAMRKEPYVERSSQIAYIESTFGKKSGLFPGERTHLLGIGDTGSYLLGIDMGRDDMHSLYVDLDTHTFFDPNLYDEHFTLIPNSYSNKEEFLKALNLYLCARYPRCRYDSLRVEQLLSGEHPEGQILEAIRKKDLPFFGKHIKELSTLSLDYAQHELYKIAAEKLRADPSEDSAKIVACFIYAGHETHFHEELLNKYFTKSQLSMLKESGRRNQLLVLDQTIKKLKPELREHLSKRLVKFSAGEETPLSHESLQTNPKKLHSSITAVKRTFEMIQSLRMKDEYTTFIDRLRLKNLIHHEEDLYLLSFHTLQTEYHSFTTACQKYKLTFTLFGPSSEFIQFASYKLCGDPDGFSTFNELLIRAPKPLEFFRSAVQNKVDAESPKGTKVQCEELCRKYRINLQDILRKVGQTEADWQYQEERDRERVLEEILSVLCED